MTRSRVTAPFGLAALLALAVGAAPRVGAAQIVYRSANIDIPHYGPAVFLNVLDGSYTTGQSPTCPGAGCNFAFGITYSGYTFFDVFAPTSYGVDPTPVAPGERGVTASLAPGAPIGASTVFSDETTLFAAYERTAPAQLVGFRFRAEPVGTVNVGWARVELVTSTSQYRIVDYAFESTPGQAIAAGDVGAAAVVPEPRTALLVGAGPLVLGWSGRGARRA